MDKTRRYFLMLAVFGLTSISVMSGYGFYASLFGVKKAVVLVLVFETIRLGCIWSLMIYGWIRNTVAGFVYALIALTCSFSAVSNFTASIMEQERKKSILYEKEISRRIDFIKRAYVEKKVSGDLMKIEDKINTCKIRLAKSRPDSQYWKNRLIQRKAQRDSLVAQRDRFLSEIPQDDRERWITKNVAWLGLELEPIPVTLRGSSTTTEAIEKIWHLSEASAKRIVGLIIIVTVEIGIVLLAFMTRCGTGSDDSANHYDHRALKALRKRFSDEVIKRFLEKFLDCGWMPPSRKLSLKQREIRKFLEHEGFNGDEIAGLIEAFKDDRDGRILSREQ